MNCPNLKIRYATDQHGDSTDPKGRTIKTIPGYITVEPQMIDTPIFIANTEIPTAHASDVELWEGGRASLIVNRYERDPRARKAYIKIFAAICSVCKFDFSKRHGEIGHGYIHMHLLKPLSGLNAKYKVNPKDDLRPVCANCHDMLHAETPAPFTIEEIRARLQPY